jgi:redox-sensitive bicupin YhaK (pirin superfamily)
MPETISGDVQVMSAGTGGNTVSLTPEQRTKLLQIWVYPNKKKYGSSLPTNHLKP